MVKRVLLPEWHRVEHLLDLRSLIESEIARTAAQRRTPDDQKKIIELVEGYRQAHSDRLSSGNADRLLHIAIARATHNPLLVDISLQLRKEVSLGFGAEPYSKDLRERALHQHPELAQAILDGDSETAAKLAMNHFLLTEDLLRGLFARVARKEEGNTID